MVDIDPNPSLGLLASCTGCETLFFLVIRNVGKENGI